MKTLHASLTAELAKTYLTQAHLIVINTPEAYLWTDFKESIYYGSAWYTSKGVVFSPANFSVTPEVESITIEVPNVDKAMSDLVLGTDVQGSECSIYRVALDNNLAVIGTASLVLLGFLDTIRINRKTAEFQIYNHMIKWRTKTPRRNHSPKCQWTFKEVSKVIVGTDTNNYTCIREHTAHAANRPITGANYVDYWVSAGAGGAAWSSGSLYRPGGCRYAAAETWCDKTPERCLALSNYANFGGFKYISELASGEIWWGQKQKIW